MIMRRWAIYADIPTDDGRVFQHRLADREREEDAVAFARETVADHPDWVICMSHPDFGMRFIVAESNNN